MFFYPHGMRRSPHPMGFAAACPSVPFDESADDYAAPCRGRRPGRGMLDGLFTVDSHGNIIPVGFVPEPRRHKWHHRTRSPPEARRRGWREHTTAPHSPSHRHSSRERWHHHMPAEAPSDPGMEALMRRLEQLQRRGQSPVAPPRRHSPEDFYGPRRSAYHSTADEEDSYVDECDRVSEDEQWYEDDSQKRIPRAYCRPRSPHADANTISATDLIPSLVQALAPHLARNRAPQSTPPRDDAAASPPQPLRITPTAHIDHHTDKTSAADARGIAEQVQQQPRGNVPIRVIVQPAPPATAEAGHAASHAPHLPPRAPHKEEGHAKANKEQGTSAAATAAASTGVNANPCAATRTASTASTTVPASNVGHASNPPVGKVGSSRRLTKSQAARIIQAYYRGWLVRSQSDTIRTLKRENNNLRTAWKQLDEICKQADGGITHKQLLEVQESAMRVLLALDACPTHNTDIRLVRKRLTKSALALQDKVAELFPGNDSIPSKPTVVDTADTTVESITADSNTNATDDSALRADDAAVAAPPTHTSSMPRTLSETADTAAAAAVLVPTESVAACTAESDTPGDHPHDVCAALCTAPEPAASTSAAQEVGPTFIAPAQALSGLDDNVVAPEQPLSTEPAALPTSEDPSSTMLASDEPDSRNSTAVTPFELHANDQRDAADLVLDSTVASGVPVTATSVEAAIGSTSAGSSVDVDRLLSSIECDLHAAAPKSSTGSSTPTSSTVQHLQSQQHVQDLGAATSSSRHVGNTDDWTLVEGQSSIASHTTTTSVFDGVYSRDEESAGAQGREGKAKMGSTRRGGVRVVGKGSSVAQTRLLRQLLQVAKDNGLMPHNRKSRGQVNVPAGKVDENVEQ